MTHWANVFGTAGFVSSQLMNFSAIPSIIEIYNAKSTLAYPSFPLAISLANAIHNIIYAFSNSRHIVMASSSLTVLFNLMFIGVHLLYSRKPHHILRLILLLPVASLILSLSYVFWTTPDCHHNLHACFHHHSKLLGLISTTMSSLSYCGQLTTIRKVIRTKSSASISKWISMAVLIRALCWTAFAISVNDRYYMASSSIGLVSGIIQLYLIHKYRHTVVDHSIKKEE